MINKVVKKSFNKKMSSIIDLKNNPNFITFTTHQQQQMQNHNNNRTFHLQTQQQTNNGFINIDNQLVQHVSTINFL